MLSFYMDAGGEVPRSVAQGFMIVTMVINLSFPQHFCCSVHIVTQLEHQ